MSKRISVAAKLLIFVITAAAGGIFAAEVAAPTTSLPSIETNAPWRFAVYDFCRTRLQHTAWGLAHSERNLFMAQQLARDEGVQIDHDVLFAAAFLHDIAAFEEFARRDVDHTEAGAEAAAEFLSKVAFPKEKIPAVQDAIRGHMFYSKVPERPEAIMLRDADTLDFLGHIGIARILSLTTRHRWAPDLNGAIATISRFTKELPSKLITKSAKKIGEERMEQMKAFLDGLDLQSNGGKSL